MDSESQGEGSASHEEIKPILKTSSNNLPILHKDDVEAEAQSLFDIYDTQKNGRLTVASLRRLLEEELYITVTDDDLESHLLALLNRYDPDLEGTLTKESFVTLYKEGLATEPLKATLREVSPSFSRSPVPSPNARMLTRCPFVSVAPEERIQGRGRLDRPACCRARVVCCQQRHEWGPDPRTAYRGDAPPPTRAHPHRGAVGPLWR